MHCIWFRKVLDWRIRGDFGKESYLSKTQCVYSLAFCQFPYFTFEPFLCTAMRDEGTSCRGFVPNLRDPDSTRGGRIIRDGFQEIGAVSFGKV